MISYDANAEERIDKLIETSVKEGNIEMANQTIIDSLEILHIKFNAHPHDSREDSLNRVHSKIRIYQKIVEAHDEIISNNDINNHMAEESLSDLERELKNI